MTARSLILGVSAASLLVSITHTAYVSASPAFLRKSIYPSTLLPLRNLTLLSRSSVTVLCLEESGATVLGNACPFRRSIIGHFHRPSGLFAIRRHTHVGEGN